MLRKGLLAPASWGTDTDYSDSAELTQVLLEQPASMACLAVVLSKCGEADGGDTSGGGVPRAMERQVPVVWVGDIAEAHLDALLH
jgi:hypothetical protein